MRRAIGGSVKALGDGRIGGYLVRFGSPEDTDLENEFFDPATEFGHPEALQAGTLDLPVLYHHGQDATLKTRILGRLRAKMTDLGIWAEAQLKMRDEYEEMVYKWAQAGKLGWSSGALPNTYEAEPAGKAWRIKSWFLGEGTLTMTPAEPRNTAVPVKSTPPVAPQRDSAAEEITPAPDAPEGTAPTPEGAPRGSDQDGTNAPAKSAPPVLPTPSQTPEEPAVALSAVEAVRSANGGAEDRSGDSPSPTSPAPTTVKEVSHMEDANTTLTTEALEARLKAFKDEMYTTPNPGIVTGSAPAYVKTLGDTEGNALAHWYKTGDTSAVKSMLNSQGQVTIKASNAVDMQVGADAEGGFAVPTGHYQGIIARMDEGLLESELGVQVIPGTGTTVSVPIDAEADGEFIETAEEAESDVDSPALGQVQMTLKRYTKRINISYELLEDEDSRLLTFIEDFVARGMRKTKNGLLVAEVAANSTKYADFAAAAIADGDLESFTFNNTLSFYDDGANRWLMQPATHGAIASISGNERKYAGRSGGDGRNILNYPVSYSAKVDPIATGNKSVYFGNWNYCAVRNGTEITLIRDNVTRAKNGQIVLHYGFRTVYKVLQAEAIGHGLHA